MKKENDGLCLFCGGQGGGKGCPGLCRHWGAEKPEAPHGGFLYDFYPEDTGRAEQTLVYRYGPNDRYEIRIVVPGRKPLK